MKHKEEYKGRGIAAETFKRSEGYGWCYRIDVGPIRENTASLLKSETTMLFEAIAAARSEIDAKKAKRV